VILRVIDRGPGIAPSDRDRVFQPFQRLGDGRRNGGGVGLGLAVARGFTEAIGGELQWEDTPGGGTTMSFSFRAQPT
jgi:two-component system, OmpR family, sensor histidine kinase KdpD